MTGSCATAPDTQPAPASRLLAYAGQYDRRMRLRLLVGILLIGLLLVLLGYALFLATYNLWGPGRVPPPPS